MEIRIKSHRHRPGEEGVVLLLVLLLVIMFTGLGLLAMRHTQGELRSASSYMDATQATEAAEAAIMMAATDMKHNWSATSDCASRINYATAFLNARNSGQRDGITVPFSDRFSQTCDPDAGPELMPDPGLNGTEPLAKTDMLSRAFAKVSLEYSTPVPAPPPPGFSTDIEGLTYCWRYVSTRSEAQFGYGATEASKVTSGNAVVSSHMKIGPVFDFECDR
jgi:hypothetical protein